MAPPATKPRWANVEAGNFTGVRKVETLGSVRHRDELTNEIILVPTPSNDPNDPLNWWV